MGIFQKLLEKYGGQSKSKILPQSFTKSYNLGMFTTVNDGQTLNPNQENDVAVIKVPQRQINKWGAGGIVAGVDVRHIMFISLFDGSTTPVQIEGTITLSNRGANGRNTIPYVAPRTETLRGSETDRTNSALLGEEKLGSIDGSYLVLSINPDTELVFSEVNSKVLIPVTIYDLKA